MHTPGLQFVHTRCSHFWQCSWPAIWISYVQEAIEQSIDDAFTLCRNSTPAPICSLLYQQILTRRRLFVVHYSTNFFVNIPFKYERQRNSRSKLWKKKWTNKFLGYFNKKNIYHDFKCRFNKQMHFYIIFS